MGKIQNDLIRSISHPCNVFTIQLVWNLVYLCKFVHRQNLGFWKSVFNVHSRGSSVVLSAPFCEGNWNSLTSLNIV